MPHEKNSFINPKNEFARSLLTKVLEADQKGGPYLLVTAEQQEAFISNDFYEWESEWLEDAS